MEGVGCRLDIDAARKIDGSCQHSRCIPQFVRFASTKFHLCHKLFFINAIQLAFREAV